jgi:hypothetical protein
MDANNLEDPNHQATHPLSVYYFMEDATLDFLGVTHDNWWAGAAGAELEEAGLVNEWVHVAFTYDADGGTCPDDADPNMCPPGTPTGYAFGYINGNPGWEGQYDPNIPEIDDDSVWIGDIASQAAKDDLGLVPFSGNIDEVRIYNYVLPHSNIMWLAGKAEPTYFPLEEPSNLYPKVGSFGYDPNNQDIVDFKDFTVIADHWLEGPTLWP